MMGVCDLCSIASFRILRVVVLGLRFRARVLWSTVVMNTMVLEKMSKERES